MTSMRPQSKATMQGPKKQAMQRNKQAATQVLLALRDSCKLEVSSELTKKVVYA